jgi:predicted nucleic acid-binding protein
MSESTLEIVCDAGPLIHLDKLGCLDLLADFQAVLVPEQVWHEVETHRPGSLQPFGVQLQRTSGSFAEYAPLQSLVRALALDLGEQAALSDDGPPDATLLTDDAAVRLAAEVLGYRVHRIIGILVRAIRRQQRTSHQVLSILRELPARSSLHIRPTLLEEIILQLGGQAGSD